MGAKATRTLLGLLENLRGEIDNANRQHLATLDFLTTQIAAKLPPDLSAQGNGTLRPSRSPDAARRRPARGKAGKSTKR